MARDAEYQVNTIREQEDAGVAEEMLLRDRAKVLTRVETILRERANVSAEVAGVWEVILQDLGAVRAKMVEKPRTALRKAMGGM